MCGSVFNESFWAFYSGKDATYLSNLGEKLFTWIHLVIPLNNILSQNGKRSRTHFSQFIPAWRSAGLTKPLSGQRNAYNFAKDKTIICNIFPFKIKRAPPRSFRLKYTSNVPFFLGGHFKVPKFICTLCYKVCVLLKSPQPGSSL